MPSLRSKNDCDEVRSVRLHSKKNVSQAFRRKTYIQQATPLSNVVVMDGTAKRLHRATTVVPTLQNPLGIGIEVILGNSENLEGKQVAMTKTSKPRGKKLNSRAGVALGRRKVCKKSSDLHISKKTGLKKELIETDLRLKLDFLTEPQFEKLRSFKVENLQQMLDLTLKQFISIGIEKKQMEILITMLKREDTKLKKLSPAQTSEELISHVKFDEDTDEENPLIIDESFTNANEVIENNGCNEINLEICCTSHSNIQVDGKLECKKRSVNDIEKHLSMMRKSKIPTFLATAAEIKSELTYIVADLNATEESILIKINESTTTATTTTSVVSSNVNSLNLNPMFVKSNQEPIISTSKQKGIKLKNNIRFNDIGKQLAIENPKGKATVKQLKKVPSNRLRSSKRATVEKKAKQTKSGEKTTVVDLKRPSNNKPKLSSKKTKSDKNTGKTISKLILEMRPVNDTFASDIMPNACDAVCIKEPTANICGSPTVNIKNSDKSFKEIQFIDVSLNNDSSTLKKEGCESIESSHEFEKTQTQNLSDVCRKVNALQVHYNLSTLAIKSTEYQHAFEEYAFSSNIKNPKTSASSSITPASIPITTVSTPPSVILYSPEIYTPSSSPVIPCFRPFSALTSSETNIPSSPSPLKHDLGIQRNDFESNATTQYSDSKEADSSNYVIHPEKTINLPCMPAETTFNKELKNIFYSKSPNSLSAASIKHELPIDKQEVILAQPTAALMNHKQRSAVDADSTTSSPELMIGKTFTKCIDIAQKGNEKMSEEKNCVAVEDGKSNNKSNDDSVVVNKNTIEKKVKLTRRSFHFDRNLKYKKHEGTPKQPIYVDNAPSRSKTPSLSPEVLKAEGRFSLSTKESFQNWDASGAITTTAHKPPTLSISNLHTTASPFSLSTDSMQTTPQHQEERDLRYKLGKYKNKDNLLQEHKGKKTEKITNYKAAAMLSPEDNVLKLTSAAIRKLAYNEEDSKDSYIENSPQQTDDCSEDWDIDEKNIDTKSDTKTFDKFYDNEMEGPQSPNEEKTGEPQHFNSMANNKVRRHINFDSKLNDENNVDIDVITSPNFSPVLGKSNHKINLNDYIPAVEIDGHMSYPAMTYFLYEFDMPKYEINKPEPLGEILHSLADDPRLDKYRNKINAHASIPQIASPVSQHAAGGSVIDPRRRNNIPPTSPYAMNNQQLVQHKQHHHQPQQQTPNMLLYGCLQRSPWYQSLMSTMKIQINQSISVLVCAINNFQKMRLEDPNAVFDIFKLYCAGELLEILENLGLFVDVNGAIIEQRSASSFGGRSFASSAPINPTYSFIQQVMPTEYTKTTRTNITSSTAPKSGLPFISCYISSPTMPEPSFHQQTMPEPSFHHTQRRHSGLKAPYMSLGSPVEKVALVQSRTKYDTEEESWDLDENIASPNLSVDNECDHKRRKAKFSHERHERFGNRYEHRNSTRERNSFSYWKGY